MHFVVLLHKPGHMFASLVVYAFKTWKPLPVIRYPASLGTPGCSATLAPADPCGDSPSSAEAALRLGLPPCHVVLGALAGTLTRGPVKVPFVIELALLSFSE